MYKINSVETQKILEGLKSDGINVIGVEDLGQFAKQAGVVVRITCGRIRMVRDLNLKALGVNVKNTREDVQQFMSDHVSSGKIFIIPEQFEKRLAVIEGSLRNKKSKMCVGYNDNYMPIGSIPAFKEILEESKTSYFALRDDIACQWESIIKDFKVDLESMLSDLEALDKTTLYRDIIKSIPSKQDYINSFYMGMNVKTFPIVETIDIFDEGLDKEIRDSIEGDLVAMAYESIGSVLNEAFVIANSMLTTFSLTKAIPIRTRGSAFKMPETLRVRNVFSNPRIEEVAAMFDDVREMSFEDMAAQSELILSKIFLYKKETGLKIDSKCILSDNVLESIGLMQAAS